MNMDWSEERTEILKDLWAAGESGTAIGNSQVRRRSVPALSKHQIGPGDLRQAARNASCLRPRARSGLRSACLLRGRLTLQPKSLAHTSRRARELVLKVFVGGELVRGNGAT
jgi:hypothetical protein